jgi:LuxR family transcriptional regulator, maltose regulon positive regulatory protein
MAEPDVTTADLVRRAEQALADTDWAAAKSLFLAALEQDESPEALDGLAQASFFLIELEEALGARERAYAAYRSAGRSVDAARMAIALAWDYRSARGERAVADGWLARARRLLEGCGPIPERGWLALREASFALPGDPARARERCAEAEALGRELGDVDIEMTAVALDGLVRVSEGRIAEGMARLDEATAAATAGEMRDPVAIGFSCCYLIFACERVRDFERAGQWCNRVAGMAEGWNIRALRAVCRAHYGTVLVLRGDWSEAERVLTEAAADLPSRSGEAADAWARLGELRRRQGRTDEAQALLARAEHHPVAVLSQAALALDRGDPTSAAEGAERFLRLLGESQVERAPGLELLAETRAAAGLADAATAAAGELEAIARAAGTDPLLGAARHASGLASAAAARHDDARRDLEDAVRLLERAGLPFEGARARVALAGALRELRRDDASQRELELARDRFRALGAGGEEQRAAGLLAAPPARPLQSEVLTLVAQGLSNKQIASRLVLSEHTVHRHVANILVKLRLSSRTAAAAYAARHGLAD